MFQLIKLIQKQDTPVNKDILKNLVHISLAYYKSDNGIKGHRCKHQAFIIKKNKIIAIGINSMKTHPANLKFAYRFPDGQGTHAEMKACLKGNKKSYKHHEMVVIRINNNGNVDMSKPCEGCQNVIKSYKIDTVWYSNKNGEFEILPIKL